ncbi:substrate-binding domain-containing protein [Streptacidiphilus sp. PAMC 29251]
MSRSAAPRGKKLTVVATALLITLGAAACSRTGAAGSTTPAAGGSSAAPVLQGNLNFNDDNLTKLDAAIKTALAGQDLSKLDEAMVVNVSVDYWNAGKVGFNKGLADLGIKGTFQAPANGRLDQQLSIIQTLRGQGITGFTVSAIDPTAIKAPITSADQAGIPVVAIDSPLPAQDGSALYLGSLNEELGEKAGAAMKTELGGKGEVVILTGSLTASNSLERIAGFKKALAGSNIKITQTLNDGSDASKALSNASTSFQTDPNVTGLYGVYSYDGPAAGQAVQSAGKTGTIKVIASDSDPQTLAFVKSGVIQATVLQQPYQQGYTGAYLLAAFKVLGKDATEALVKPYLESDGTTLSTGAGVVTQGNIADYQAMLTKLGIG